MTIAAFDPIHHSQVNVYSVPPPVEALLSPLPFDPFRTASSISSMNAEDESRNRYKSRFILEPPKPHYMLDLFAVQNKLENTICKEVKIFKTESHQTLQQIEKLENEKAKAVQQYTQETASSIPWSALANVTKYVAAATSITTGASIVTLGGPATWIGSILLVSGITGMTKNIVQDTVGFKQLVSYFTNSIELQQKVSRDINKWACYTELGTGLVGAVGGCFNGTFSTLATSETARRAITKVTQAMNLGNAVMNKTFELKQHLSDKGRNDVQVFLKRSNNQAQERQMELNQATSQVAANILTAQTINNALQDITSKTEIQDL